MSHLTIKYYLEETIESKLKCESCQKKFNLPKIQPCGCSICVDCETNILKKNQISDEIECFICHEKYELAKTSFILNKCLINLLNISPISVYRGKLHAVTMQELHDSRALTENLMSEINDPKSVIIKFCELQTNAVDIRTECLMKSLSNQRDYLLTLISNFKTECLEEINNLKYEKFLESLRECEKKYESITSYLNESNINDDEIQKKLNEISNLTNCFEKNKSIFDAFIFNKKKIDFVECDFDLENNNIVGSFQYISLLDDYFKGINHYQSIKKINYEKENKKPIVFPVNSIDEIPTFSFNLNDSSIRAPPYHSISNNKIKLVTQTTILEVVSNIFCIIMKYKQNDKFNIHMKTFSIDDVLINEKSEELQNGIVELKTFIFQGNILILQNLNNNEFSLKVYNSALNECESKNLNLKNLNKSFLQNTQSSFTFGGSANNPFQGKLFKYSIMISKSKFYILRSINEDTYGLASIDKNLDISLESIVPVGIFNFKSSFIESNKIFTFENDKLNIFNLSTYAKLKTIIFGTAYLDCLFHLIDEENFAVINPKNKLFSYLNISSSTMIEREFKIENMNKISSFFVTKNYYLALHDDEEKLVYILTDGSLKAV